MKDQSSIVPADDVLCCWWGDSSLCKNTPEHGEVEDYSLAFHSEFLHLFSRLVAAVCCGNKTHRNWVQLRWCLRPAVLHNKTGQNLQLTNIRSWKKALLITEFQWWSRSFLALHSLVMTYVTQFVMYSSRTCSPFIGRGGRGGNGGFPWTHATMTTANISGRQTMMTEIWNEGFTNEMRLNHWHSRIYSGGKWWV